ncbi:arginine N-succinyltransferase [Leptolyngbya sp. 15MV]|nr:arginine N-succinyltransferase [Leptolyngbya sp. 15MV]
MFVIRQSKPRDVATLLKLARMVYFINLPPNESIIGEKIQHSLRCFVKAGGGHVDTPAESGGRPRVRRGVQGLAHAHDSDLFMFTIEEVETDTDGRRVGEGAVVGTCQVRAHMGGPGNPNWSMKLSERKFFSPELGQGTTHTVAQLYGDESGPSEIGGLILQPSHRGHKLRPGRLLSFVRFHFIGLHRGLFADRVLAEMMAPVSSEGDNAFWDAFGRKFIPVRYAEADRFCQHNRAFIKDLLPKEEIYVTLLPLEIQNMVGAVSKETVPARRLLESLGFRFRGFIDPFDAGPHLDAATDEISLVKQTRRVELGKPLAEDRCDQWGIVSVLNHEGEFRAVEGPCALSGPTLRTTAAMFEALRLEGAPMAGFTPLQPPGTDSGPKSSKGRSAGGRGKKVRA